MKNWKKTIVWLAISTLAATAAAGAVLIFIEASVGRIPDTPSPSAIAGLQRENQERSPENSAPLDYKAIADRNLFRAQLQVEIPKPKTEKELEEEALTAIVKTMALKGVMIGVRQRETYAVIDRGGQKGVWTYEAGEVIERGLTLKEIRKDSIKVEKGEFAAVLKLFSPVYEKTPGPQQPTAVGAVTAQPPQKKSGQEVAKLDLGKEIKKEGRVTVISKTLAEKLKSDNNVVLSSIAVKASADGLKVVAVDRGSVAQRMGIAPDDTLQEINGHRLNSSQDMNKVYEALRNVSTFDVKVLRRGRSETLRYEIR
jgi:type II secretory pathway component PulC